MIPGKLKDYSDSSMLKRVRITTGLRPVRIPRKGRIRIALGIALVALAVIGLRGKVGGTTNFAGESGDLAAGDSTPVKIEAIRRAPKKIRAETKKPSRERSLKNMGLEDVAGLLERRPPRLVGPVDTLETAGGQAALYYSLDTLLQRRGKQLLARYKPKYGAIAVLDPVSGRVLSLVSYVNEGEPYLGSDLYCKSLFPAASIFKVVTAAGAVEQGQLSGSSMLRQSGRNHTLYRSQLEKNQRDYREISLDHAFAYSINPVFGRLGIYVLGKDGLASYAKRFGFAETVPFELPCEPSPFAAQDSAFELAELACGFNQRTRISPLLGALIAGAIAEGGLVPRPRLVDSIVVLNTAERAYSGTTGLWKRAVNAHTAGELKQMMMSVARFGTARKSFALVRNTAAMRGLEYGGKTGSVDKDGVGRVDWFVGFARDPSDAGRRLAVGVVTVHGPYWTVHSSYVAAELFRAHFRQLENRKRAQQGQSLAVQSPGGGIGKVDSDG